MPLRDRHIARILLPLFFSTKIIMAADWVITEGGLSPDKKLAVAVYPQQAEFIDEADGTVLLIDQTRGRKIGPLEEIDSTGGTWGVTTKNVRCCWSPDGSLLLVTFRIGRLMHTFQAYRIAKHRAIPLKLPDSTTHPKGKVLEVLGYNANPGSTISLSTDGSIVERRYGFMPKKGHWDEDYSKFGLKGFDAVGGTLLFVYRFDARGKLKLDDIKIDPDSK